MKRYLLLPTLFMLCACFGAAESLLLNPAELHYFHGEEMFPLRKVAEFAGYLVHYIPGEITLTSPQKELYMNLKDGLLVANGHRVFLWPEPCLIDSVCYVPVNFLQDHLRLDVKSAHGQYEIVKAAENQLQIKNETVTYTDQYLNVQMQYPQVDGLPLDVQKLVNSAVEEKVTALKKTVFSDREGLLTDPPRIPYDYYLNYLVKRNRDNILSILFEDYYFTGGAHGIGYKFAFNFDLETGRQYTLPDLFAPEINYIAFLNEQINEQIAKSNFELDYYWFESIAQDQVFYFTADALVICFQSYEIAPYAAGKPEFAISFSQLEEILHPRLRERLLVKVNAHLYK